MVMNMNDVNNTYISLLFPDESYSGQHSGYLDAAAASGLELHTLIELKSSDIESYFTDDVNVIRYRQSAIADAVENPEIVETLEKMLPILSDITELRQMTEESSDISDCLSGITEAELYVSLIGIMRDGILPYETKLKSDAMRTLAARVRKISESEYYADLNERLKKLTSRVREIKSVTIGVNLNAQMRVQSAGVLSVNNERVSSGDVMEKILRLDFKKGDLDCIAPLTPFSKGMNENKKEAMDHAFRSAIEDVFKSSMRSWRATVQHYVLENADFLIRMMPEIEFISRAVELIGRLKDAGCTLCTPEIRPAGEKAFVAVGLTNPVIAMKTHEKMVENDISFDENGMLYVLTGPNRGGKSVLTTAVGLAFVMTGLGLPVTARELTISPCDSIFTHFPTGSEDTVDKGRLGEECARLSDIFDRVTPRSLVLLDETFSSTGSFEGAYIASEVLAGLSLAGCRGIFSTHLHSLAASVDQINEDVASRGGVKIDNLSAEIDGSRRSFRIIRKAPDGKSHARDIAEKYGLSLSDIERKLAAKRSGVRRDK